ncbi:MAG: signal peptidase I [halophilic archaeon J07HX64]|nr:MAG: signal peptidase I [halophilic archaeon J07HX64]
MSPPEESDADTLEEGEKKGPEGWGVETSEEEGGTNWALLARDLATSVVSVLLLGAYLFAVSGIWPPMVAIESGSMEPNMQVNDLAFVMDTDRFQPNGSVEMANGSDTGVVTAAVGTETGYSQFGNSGDVIVFEPNGDSRRTPIIHRAMFWVEQGENWCEHEAIDPAFLRDTDEDRCTATHAGFITKGDNNPTYDQAGRAPITAPVRPGWVIGTAETRIPWLGWFRLQT